MLSKFGIEQKGSKAEKVEYLGWYVSGLWRYSENMMVDELVEGEGGLLPSYEDGEGETFEDTMDHCD